MTSSDLFGGLFVPDEARVATSDRAWIQAMLDFESALAVAESELGMIPAQAGEAIAAACKADHFDAAAIGRAGRSSANPAAPLVKALIDAVGGEASGYVHWGATSQDAIDSAAMLVAKRTLVPLDADLAAVAAACARLADEHRETPMVGRTLLQQALPTTFGYKAAGWLVSVVEARQRLASIPLPVQLGGGAGTLAALGTDGARVLELVAERLDLEVPVLPWHTARGGVAELGSALALSAGALAKVALDVALLAQTEVGEVAEPGGGGRGGSSTMPQKRNPAGSTLAIACERRVRAEASILLAAMAQEHERAAGAWQSEWEALAGGLAYSAGAAAAMREVLEGLQVNDGRMRENLASGGGLVMSEAVSMALAAEVGRPEAQAMVGEAARRVSESGRTLREELLDDERVRELLSAEQMESATDPQQYLGSAAVFVDRALAAWEEGR